MNRHTMGRLACGLALILTAACSSSGALSTNGPFGNGGPNTGMICAPIRAGEVAHSGFEEFPNTGGTATIDRVVLADPRHLRLVAAWAVPMTGTTGVDIGQGYPAASSVAFDAPDVRWRLRQRIPGAVVRHTRGQERINLVIVAKPSGRVGTSKAVDLYYESAGTHYLLHFPYGFTVRVGHTC